MQKNVSEHARAAKEIRIELKRQFPSIKFTVISDSFSMGNSVNIGWTDGPLSSSVNAVVKKYQYGNFNSMEDIYEYSNKIDGIPQVKYVQTSRGMSAETKQTIKDRLSKEYGINMDDDKAVYEKFDCWPSQVIYREFVKEALAWTIQNQNY